MGVYSAIRLTKESADALRNWAIQMGFEGVIDIKDMHITTCYSFTDFVAPEPKKFSSFAIIEKILRSGADEKTIVLVLSNDEAVERNAELKTLGATSQYEGYTPHISVSYSDANVDVTGIEVPDLKLYLDQDYFEELNRTWTA